MKKLVMFFTIAMIVVLCTAPICTSAMTEKEFLNYLKSENLGDYYIQNAESLFKTYDFTADQLDKAKQNANSVIALIKAKNPEALNDPTKVNKDNFTTDQKNEIISAITNTASMLGFKAVTSTDAKGNTVIKVLENTSNKVLSTVSAADGALKITAAGVSSNPFILIMLIAAIIAAGAFGITYSKRKVIFD